MKRTVFILGATGSIGTNAVWVCDQLRDDIRVHGLAARSNWQKLAEQATLLGTPNLHLADPTNLENLRAAAPAPCRIATSPDHLIEMVTAPEVSCVLCAITGTAGLAPVLAAIRAGKDIALASKEILVMAGELVMQEAARAGVRILPVDSEHSAIFQCMHGWPSEHIRRLILTASGGPFRRFSTDQLDQVTYADALAHPTWDMGPKVTIDSATMMNKALEIIEAHWLFGLPEAQIDVLVHPQSVVHSLVEFVDGGMLAQLGNPDMRLPIQLALTYPERRNSGIPACDLTSYGSLQFEDADPKRFPALRLAREALRAGGTMSTVLNAANEVAVDGFSRGDLRFRDIAEVVERVMERHQPRPQTHLDEVFAADTWARATAQTIVSREI